MENLIHVSFSFILEQLDLSNSSVVYVRVQTAEVVNGSLNETFVTFFLGCIAGYGYDLAFISLSVQFFNGFLTGFFITVGDYDIVAILKQLVRNAAANPTVPTSNDSNALFLSHIITSNFTNQICNNFILSLKKALDRLVCIQNHKQ